MRTHSPLRSAIEPILRLPEPIDQKGLVRQLLEHWARRAPLLSHVLARHTTFTAAIQLFVTEWGKIKELRFPHTPNDLAASEEFQSTARTVLGSIRGILIEPGEGQELAKPGPQLSWPIQRLGGLLVMVLTVMIYMGMAWWVIAPPPPVHVPLGAVLFLLLFMIVPGVAFTLLIGSQLVLMIDPAYFQRLSAVTKLQEDAQWLDNVIAWAYGENMTSDFGAHKR